jgi:hypothetical protein
MHRRANRFAISIWISREPTNQRGVKDLPALATGQEMCRPYGAWSSMDRIPVPTHWDKMIRVSGAELLHHFGVPLR